MTNLVKKKQQKKTVLCYLLHRKVLDSLFLRNDCFLEEWTLLKFETLPNL